MADTMKTLAIRMTLQAQDIYKELGTLDKAMDQFNLKQETGSKRTTQSIVKGVREQSSAKKKMQVEILKGIHQEALAVEKAGAKVASVQKAKQSVIRKANAELAAAVEKAARKEIEVTNAVFRKRLDTVKKSSDEWVRIEADRIKQVQKLERQASTAGAKAQRLGKPMEGFGKINRANAELAENFATITRSLQSGDLAGIASMFGGPIAGAIGTAVDVALQFTGVLKDLGLAAQKIDNTWIQLNKTIVQFNEGMDTGILVQLEVQLQALQRPLGVTEEAMIRIAQKLAVKTPPESLVAATKAALDLQRVTTALGETVSMDKLVGTGVGALSTVTQDTVEAVDILALASTKLAGVVDTGVDEAMTEIGNVASKALGIIKDGKKAAQESAALLIALTDSGFQVSEATSTAEGAYESLTEVMNDPALLEAIGKKLPDSISLLDAGLKQGDVSIVKFLETLTDMGDAGTQLAATLSGTGADAFNLLIKNADRIGNKLPGLVEEFKNSSGAAARLADSMTPLSVKMQEFNDQQLADMRTNLGRSFTGLIEGSQKSLSSFLSTVATADFSGLGIIGDMLDGIRDLFVDSGVEAERAFQKYEAANDAANAIADLNEEAAKLQNKDLGAFLLRNIEQIKAEGGPAAAEIERLAKASGEITADGAKEMLDVLAGITDLAGARAAVTAQASIDQAMESIRDLVGEAESYKNLVGAGATGGYASELSLATIEANKLRSAGLTEQLAALEKVKDLTNELANAEGMTHEGRIGFLKQARRHQEKINEKIVIRGNIETEVLTAARNMLDIKRNEAEEVDGIFKVEEALLLIEDDIKKSLGVQVGMWDDIRGSLIEAEDATEAIADNTEAAVEPNVEIAALLAQQEAAAQALGVAAADNSDEKKKQLEAEIALNESIVAQIDIQIAAIELAIEDEDLRADAVKRVAEAQLNLNNLKLDEAAITAGGTGAGTTVAELTPESDKSQLEAIRATLQAEKANIEALNGRIRQTIHDMGDGARREQARQDKANEKAAKDAEKAAKERLARRARMAQEVARLDAARLQRLRDGEKEERQLRANELAAREERIKTERELSKTLQGMVDDFRRQGTEAVGGGVSRAASILGIDPEGIAKLTRLQAEYQDRVNDLAQTQVEMVEALDDQLREQRELFRAVEREEQAGGIPAGHAAARYVQIGGGLKADIEAIDRAIDRAVRDRELAEQTLARVKGLEDQENIARGTLGEKQDIEKFLKDVLQELTALFEPLVERREAALAAGSALASERGIVSTEGLAAVEQRVLGETITTAAETTAELRDSLQGVLDSFAELLKAGGATEQQMTDLSAAMDTLLPQELETGIVDVDSALQGVRGTLSAIDSENLTEAQALDLAAIGTSVDGVAASYATYTQKSPQFIADLLALNAVQETLKLTAEETAEAVQHNATQQEAAAQAELAALSPVERATLQLQEYLKALALTIKALKAQAKAQGDAFSEEDIKRLEDAKKAFADISKELETGGGIISEAVQEQMDEAMATFSKVISSIEQGMSKVVGMVEAIQGGDAGAIAAEGIELTKLVGKTLMQAPYPLNIVGAVLLAAGLIAQVIKTIVELVVKPVKSRLDLAKEAAEAEERILELYKAQRAILDGQIEAGDRRVDQAWEQVEAQEALIRGLIAGSEILKGLAGLTEEELADEEKRLIEQKAAIPGLVEQYGERITRDQRQTFLKLSPEQQAEATRQYRQPLVDLGMSESEIDDFLNMSRKKRVEFLEAMGIDIDAQLLDIDELQGAYSVLHDNERAAIEEEIDLQRTLNRLGQSQEETQRNILDIRRKALNAALESMGFGDVSGMSPEALKAFMATMGEAQREQLSGIMDIVNAWLDAGEAVEALAGSEEKLFQKRKRELEQKRKLGIERGGITEAEFQEQMLALLQEELAVRIAIEESLDAEVDSAGTILDAEIARRDIEIDIQTLLEGQNSEMLETDSILDGIIRKRQALLAGFREGKDGGTLSTGERARLEATTEQAVARLRELGASDEEIQKFRDSLPQFDTGGPIPMDMPIMAHKGEHMVTADQVAAAGHSALAGIGVESGSMFRTPEARILQQAAMAEREMLSSFAGITQVNNFYGEVKPDDLASANEKLEQDIINIVNRANAQGLQLTRR